jgi:[heparan sulfate]-glucosamine 3-sulfotransferase 1
LKHKGTAALRAFINIHPQIQTTPQEVNFFDRYYNRGLNWYINQMTYLFVNQIAIEKTPAYFTSNRDNVPKLIHQMNPKIRLILLV